MNSDQIALVIELIQLRADIAAHPQTPPRSWIDRAEELEAMLRATAKEAEAA